MSLETIEIIMQSGYFKLSITSIVTGLIALIFTGMRNIHKKIKNSASTQYVDKKFEDAKEHANSLMTGHEKEDKIRWSEVKSDLSDIKNIQSQILNKLL